MGPARGALHWECCTHGQKGHVGLYTWRGGGERYFYERIWLFMMGDIPVVDLRKGSEMCI